MTDLDSSIPRIESNTKPVVQNQNSIKPVVHEGVVKTGAIENNSGNLVDINSTNTIKTKIKNTRYINILTSVYEGGSSDLYDPVDGRVLFHIPDGEAQKITQSGSVLDVLVAGIYAPNMLYHYNIETHKLIDKKVINNDEVYLQLLGK